MSWRKCTKLALYHSQNVAASLAPAAALRHAAGSPRNTMGFHSLLCGDQVVLGQTSCWLSLSHLLSHRVFGRGPTRPNVPLSCSNTHDFEEGVKLTSPADGVHKCMQALKMQKPPTRSMGLPGTRFQGKLGRLCFVLRLILLVPELKEQLTLPQQNGGLLCGARCGLQPPCKASEHLHGAFLWLPGKALFYLFIFFLKKEVRPTDLIF